MITSPIGAEIEIADINGAIAQNLEKNEQAVLEITNK